MSTMHYYTHHQRVSYFLSKGKEGECWDFKQEWHEDIDELMKDIICFANTVHDEDCYIVFGVTNSLEVVGMKKERRKQADIIDAISHLHFAGDNYPKIAVDTIEYEGRSLDILIIYNNRNTPIYLKQQYGKMKPGCIYLRTEDKNTPDNSNADIIDIENLWKKRLGLTKTPLQYIYDRLQNKLEWSESDGCIYNIYHPEYMIEIEYEDDRNWSEFYCYAMPNSCARSATLLIKCHGTVLKHYQLAELDSGRLLIPVPEWGYVCHDQYGMDAQYQYKYYVKGSNEHIIASFLYDPENGDARYALQHLLRVVLVYESTEERLAFESFLEANQDLVQTRFSAVDQYDYINAETETMTAHYKKQLRTGVVLKNLLDEFRQNNWR